MEAEAMNADRKLELSAGGATVALTLAAFGLSYAHLAEVAHTYGMGTVAGWVWPGTIDTFIMIGELLVLRAMLRGGKDWFAYFLTVAGSLGSVALNVAGVGPGKPVMNYVVAAVPPVAALLAFAALMRGVHARLMDSEVSTVDAPVSEAVSTEDTDADTVDASVSAPLSLVAPKVDTPPEEVSAVSTQRTQVNGGGHPRVDSVRDRVSAAADSVDAVTVRVDSVLSTTGTDRDTIIREGWTRGHSVRDTADAAGCSKSTVHKRYKMLDLTEAK
jgi:hypothetical protein